MKDDVSILISNLYFDLILLLDGSGKGYFVALDEFINSSYNILEINYLEKIDPLNEYTTTNTKNKFEEFRVHWLNYLRDNEYSEDGILIQFDLNWKLILKNKLIPALNELENDLLDKFNIIAKAHYSFNISTHPSDEDIIERGRFLYKLLIENKILKRTYLDV